ncbi:Hypothetical protein Bdt_3297 [Bdellovibrio bacteriovorus str. Tiberius]|uniref:Uncharacterized protein n=1 Tax=Bdellovibrio bacteriovorus str. Tiberius TaxID=1069642 RepID=K7ZH04_BDEBC|nr:Hypothetical protein Bdt_3297 [Bdellovibrio bacteriovorus str. Tiberius]
MCLPEMSFGLIPVTKLEWQEHFLSLWVETFMQPFEGGTLS